jgi:hypothetical protein
MQGENTMKLVKSRGMAALLIALAFVAFGNVSAAQTSTSKQRHTATTDTTTHGRTSTGTKPKTGSHSTTETHSSSTMGSMTGIQGRVHRDTLVTPMDRARRTGSQDTVIIERRSGSSTMGRTGTSGSDTSLSPTPGWDNRSSDTTLSPTPGRRTGLDTTLSPVDTSWRHRSTSDTSLSPLDGNRRGIDTSGYRTEPPNGMRDTTGVNR